MCSYTSIYFSKNFRKNILDFFREFILLGNSFLTRLRLPFCWPSFFGAIFSALSPGIHRLALVCSYAQVSLVDDLSPVIVFFDVFLCAASCFAAHSSGFSGGFLRRTFDNVFSSYLSSPLTCFIVDKCFFRRFLFRAWNHPRIAYGHRPFGAAAQEESHNLPFFSLRFSRRLPLNKPCCFFSMALSSF